MTFLLAFFLFWETAEPPFYTPESNSYVTSHIQRDIEKSQKSVDLSIYSFTSRPIMRAMRRKAQEGVDVTVLIDRNKSHGLKNKLGNDIKLYPYDGQGLMHHKLLVIDRKIVWLGSANFTYDGLGKDANFMQRIESEELANFVAQKIHSLAFQGFRSGYPARTFQLKDQTLEFWFLPDNSDASLKLKNLMRSAQKSIKVAMFTFTRRDLAQELVRAANRGVKVQVILDNAQCAGCQEVINILKQGNIDLTLWKGSKLMHDKFMVIDDTTLVHGSANWTHSAFRKNEDFFVILSPLSQEQAEFLKKKPEQESSGFRFF